MSVFKEIFQARPDPELKETVGARLHLALDKARDNAVYASRNASPMIASQSEAEVLQMLANEQADNTLRAMNVPTAEATALGSAIMANEVAKDDQLDIYGPERPMQDAFFTDNGQRMETVQPELN